MELEPPAYEFNMFDIHFVGKPNIQFKLQKVSTIKVNSYGDSE